MAVKQVKGRKRKLSKRQRTIYRRRRIVVGVALVLVLALTLFCVYSIARFAGATGAAISGAMHRDDLNAVSRSAVPRAKMTTGIPDCGGDDLELSLTAESQSVPVGGSIKLSATSRYTGSSAKGCLLTAFSSSRVITITSGHETVWRSDVCPVDSKDLLMAKGNKEVKEIVWNVDANASLNECTDESTWPRVNPGTYTAKLSLKNHPKVSSDPVNILVQ